MGQITIYLDDGNDNRLKAAAKAEGISVSRWIARLVEAHTRTEWPASVRELAGAWPDFPDAGARQNSATDTAREQL